MANADIWISFKKIFIAFIIFLVSAGLTSFMQSEWAAIPLGAVLMGTWNFVKHQWLE